MFIEVHDDEPGEFNAYHMPALEQNETRHTLLLSLMVAAPSDPAFQVRRWTLGEPGACAIQTAANRPILLGELNEVQCHTLAEFVGDCPGVVGADEAPQWFAARARQLGMTFKEPTPQRIHVLTTPPVYPGSPGAARKVEAADADLFVAWSYAFCDAAVPNDPKPTQERLMKRIAAGDYLFWEVDGKPVAMADSVRRTRNTGSIAGVYTPPEFRGKGYGGSVTAAVAERIFAEGKAAVCLYTDLRNPYSNRCYAKIGFKPVCDSWHYARQGKEE